MYSKTIKLIISFIAAISFIACDSNTEPEPGKIPDDVTPFATAEQAAEIAFSSIMGIGDFIDESIEYKEMEESSAGTMQAQSDTVITYYDAKSGWWHRSGTLSFGGDSGGISFEYDNQFQFFRNDTLLQWPVNIDAMHIIMDMMASFSFISSDATTNSTIVYKLDMMYTGLDTDVITIDGDGHYDIKISVQSTEGTQNLRYYLLYTLDELQVPEEGYPTGTVTVETKNFKITIVFDGTDTARVTVKKDGSIVWEDDKNLDDDVY